MMPFSDFTVKNEFMVLSIIVTSYFSSNPCQTTGPVILYDTVRLKRIGSSIQGRQIYLYFSKNLLETEAK